jgi:hypothetical protein
LSKWRGVSIDGNACLYACASNLACLKNQG